MPRPIIRRRRERGSAIVEFALTAPMLLGIIGGVMDFSNSLYTATAVANAAIAGVAYGGQAKANNTNYTGMQTAATAAQPYVSGLTATATEYCETSSNVSTSCSGSFTRAYIKVTTSAPYSLLAGYIILPTSLSATAAAYRRII